MKIGFVMKPIYLIATAILLAASGQLQAGIIWDYSPVTTGASVTNNNYSNETFGQNFAERIEFGSSTSITGMDIYMSTFFGSVGDVGTVRLWSDNAGTPSTLLSEFTEMVTAVDSVGAAGGNHRVHVDFSNAVSLNANTQYWIGLSGTTAAWTQTGLSVVDDDRLALFSGASFFRLSDPQIGDMAFRLHGTIGAVPEPTSLAIFGTICLAACGRRRKS